MSADERGRRLVELKDAIKAFFEVTGVVGSGWSAAFQAVRQNDHMATTFLADLRALTDFIEVEFDQTLVRPSASPAKRVTPVSTARVAPAARTYVPLARAGKPTPPPAAPPPPARKPTPAPPRPAFIENKTMAVDPSQVVSSSLVPRPGREARPVPPPPARPPLAGKGPARRFSPTDEVHTNVDPPVFDDDEDTGRRVTPPPPKRR